MCKKLWISAAALAICCLSSCGVVEWIEPQTVTSTQSQTTTVSHKSVNTTKTAVYDGDVDDDDEGMEGYTTTTAATAGTLENEYSRPDDVDEAMRATQRSATSTARTYYTLPEHNGTTGAGVTSSTTTSASSTTSTTTVKTTTTTTAFKANALFPLTGEYGSAVSYKVTSDTTYLNLRFGPSKSYDVQLRIPDGEHIKGRGETTDSLGNVWVYTSYNGTEGWVMRELLTKE